jgi:hypothetical protein
MSVAVLSLKMYVINGIKMPEQPLIIKDADLSGRYGCHR